MPTHRKDFDPASLFDGPLADAVKASAQQIWLAGVGAFAKAQEEGSKAFDTLVQEGAELRRKRQTAQGAAEDKLGEFGETLNAMAGEAMHKAGASWEKLEAKFEARTAQALKKMGVPTAQDMASLNAQVEALTAQVAKLSTQLHKTKQQSAKAASGLRAKKAAAAAKPARKAVRKTSDGASD
ncbi:MAG TPA: phasin family protein [Ideonella sp.]|uniref:phasin family protein n=1 Tax=Ideonella sp. TaxID=1929293 RepID=UPI002C77A95D|nr:phasin family protein [Ideonella sp.]HSI51118.1 phasin family protein [Ideonella sp.]